jgi:hypothetical protein
MVRMVRMVQLVRKDLLVKMVMMELRDYQDKTV